MMRKHSDGWIYRRLLIQARPYWPHLAGILALSLLAAPLALLTPLPLKIVVDSAIGSQPLPGWLAVLVPSAAVGTPTGTLIFAIALLFVITIASQLRGFLGSLLDTYTGAKLVLAFRAELFRRVQHLSLAYHDRKGAMDSVYRIQYDAPAIQWVAVQGVIPFASSILTVVGMTIVMARIDPELALVALLVTPFLFGVTHVFRRRIRKQWSKVKEIESSTMSGVQEALSSLRVVKAFGQEGRESERFRAHSEQNLQVQLRLARINGGFDGLIGITIAASTAVALYVGVRHVQTGELTLGSLLLVMAYLSQLYSPLAAISRKIGDLQASLVSAERAFALLEEPRDVPEKPDARPLARARGAVAFRHVGFAYPHGPEVIHDVSFEVAPGDRVGIMGATGAGKTTLMSLLMRFYDPGSGKILLDGEDIRDLRTADLRSQVSIVLQEPVLFSTSVAENIAYARPNATMSEIVEAARLANAHEFINRLPQGYQTRVGERGMALSGGERQRIALARAFLRDAPILILDEPTSSIDVRTEAAIMEATETLMRGRTAFMIAHRVSTLERCNVHLHLEHGRLVSSAQPRARPQPTAAAEPDIVGIASDAREDATRV
jgi:ATP-binding cassette subfamily B protein